MYSCRAGELLKQVQTQIIYIYIYIYRATIFLTKKIIDFKIARSFLRGNLKYFNWFLNTGNFFVNRKSYLDCSEIVFRSKNLTSLEADAFVFSYFWLKSGNKIKILDFIYYYHRMRKESYSFHKNNSKSMEKYLYLFKYDFFPFIFFIRILNKSLPGVYNYFLKFFYKK